MAYYALYLEDGTLVGVTNSEPVALLGISIKEMTEAPNLSNSTWNQETLEFTRSSTIYTKLEFKNKFTIQERLAARSSTDPIVQDILEMTNIAEYVDITDSTTIQGIYYLVAVGILTNERATEILQ